MIEFIEQITESDYIEDVDLIIGEEVGWDDNKPWDVATPWN